MTQQKRTGRQPPDAERDAKARGPAGGPRAVVGIGASAGGVEALIALFGALPDDLGAAYLVALHTEPTSKSHLREILGRHSKLPFTVVEAPTVPEPDQIYVALPGRMLVLHGGALNVLAPGGDLPSWPLDSLFLSLAEERGPRAVAVIGTGSHGVTGAAHVRAEGGLVIAQDPSTTAHDLMPRHAIHAGVVDLVLAPDRIADGLAGYLRHDYVRREEEEGEAAERHMLHAGGYLVLGEAESVGTRPELFEPVSKKWRIYRKIGPTSHDQVEFPLAVPGTDRRQRERGAAYRPRGSGSERPHERLREVLLERYAPASVLVDADFRILYFHGPTERYLKQPRGEPRQNLLAMALEGLRSAIRRAARKAVPGGVTPAAVEARIEEEGRPGRRVRVVATSLSRTDGGSEPVTLVSFEEADGAPLPEAVPERDEGATSRRWSGSSMKPGRSSAPRSRSSSRRTRSSRRRTRRSPR